MTDVQFTTLIFIEFLDRMYIPYSPCVSTHLRV